MEYDYLKVKRYSVRQEKSFDGNIMCILSFDDKHHIRVSSIAKNIMDNFNGKKTAKEVIAELNSKNINFNHYDLVKFVDEILVGNLLLEGMEESLEGKSKSRLWVHLPIVDSTKFNELYKVLKFLYNKYIALIIIILTLLIIGINLVDGIFFGGFRFEINNLNSLMIIGISYGSLVAHEFGHITAAAKYNIKSGKMGIGMYLIYPVIYVDMTNSWRLGRNGRVLVDIGGIYFQIITVIPLAILYLITKAPTLKISMVLVVFLTLANLIPILKLDGYWLLTDYLSLPNVSLKSMDFIKVFLHKKNKQPEINFQNKVKYSKSEVAYGVYGVVYLLSTMIMIIYGLFLSIETINKSQDIISKLGLIAISLRHLDFSTALLNSNKLFILIIPTLFILYALLSVIKGFIKGVLSKTKRKVMKV